MPEGLAPDASAGTSVPCDQLDAATLGLEQTTLHVAEVVASGSLELPGMAAPIEELPRFCRVAGRVEAAIEFEVWLPIDTHDERLVALGNGAMGGAISFQGLGIALRNGFAAVATDTGHTVTGSFDASWALNRPDLIEDFGHRALHVSVVNAKKIARAFYGEPPRYSYYAGCSKGGQQGLMAAQRYPEDFDGIVVGNPAHDWTRFYAGGHLWYALATLEDPDSYIPADKLPLITDAVNRACDALDGIEDGIIHDPRDCAFDPATLLCSSGQDPATCLGDKQVGALEKIYAGATDSAGQLIYPGLTPGSESAGWAGWVTGAAPFQSLHYLAAHDFFRFMVFDDPDWDFRTFDYDRDVAFALGKVGAALDAVDPDLSAFRDRGGKILMYHGWADPDISPYSAIDYYDSVVAHLGGRDEVDGWFRLFMAPGMGHCAGGPGPDSFDTAGAIQAWLEEDVAPDRLVAAKNEGGRAVRTRPLCPHPMVARYTGSGSTDDAASFECVAR
jgi:feruloyl esterase